MKLIACLLLCLPLYAQSFRILPSSAARGAESSIQILLVSPAGNEPVALQWKITLGAGLTGDVSGITEGEAATASRKSIVCTLAAGSANASPTYACILSGGQESIANGVVFKVKYRVAAEAKRGPVPLRISDAIAASAASDQLQRTDIPSVSASIDIR